MTFKKTERGTLCSNFSQGIRLVEQTEQKFRRFESVLKKTSDCNSRALLLKKAALTKNHSVNHMITEKQYWKCIK